MVTYHSVLSRLVRSPVLWQFIAVNLLADMVLTQALVGLLLIIVFLRTRSLLSGVVLHRILDTFGSLIQF